MDISDIPKPTSIIHRQCGEEAFKYIGDVAAGTPIYIEKIIGYHPDYELSIHSRIVCKSCGGRVEGLRHLYPQLNEVS